MNQKIYTTQLKLFRIPVILFALACFLSYGMGVNAQTHASFPYFNDFESGSLGNEWSSNSGSGEVDVRIVSSPDANVNPNGNYALELESDNPPPAELDLHLGGMNNACRPRLSFFMTHNDDEKDGDEGIWVSTDGGSSFTKIYDMPVTGANDDQWQFFDLNLAQLMADNGLSVPASGEIVLRIVQQATINSESHAYDDLSVYEAGDPYKQLKAFTFSSSFPSDWSRSGSATSEVQMDNSCDGSDGYNLQLQGKAGAYAETPAYDFSQSDSANVIYEYRKGGPGCGDEPEAGDVVEVQYWDGSQWVTGKSYDGGTAPSSFTKDTLTINSGLNSDLRIRFEVQGGDGIGNDNWNFDNLEIYSDLLDVGVVDILSPNPSNSDLGLEPVNVIVRNNVKKPLPAGTTIPIKFETSLLDQPRTIQYTLQNTLNCSDTLHVDLGRANFNCDKAIDLRAWTDLPADGNRNNDTVKNNYAPLYGFDDFESGSLGSKWDDFSGASVVTSSNAVDPMGTYMLELDASSNGYADLNVDLSGSYTPLLGFYMAHDDDEKDGGEGILVSTDGGNTFTEIYDLPIGNSNENRWEYFELDLIQLMNANGLSVPSDGKIIVRFQGDATISSETHYYDMIRIFESEDGQKGSVPGQFSGFTQPDTVFVDYPTTFTSKTVGQEGYKNYWYVNGQLQGEDKEEFKYAFPDTGKNVDTVSLITTGDCGIDTTTKVIDVYYPTQPPVTDFIASKTEGLALETIRFNDITQNAPSHWNWTIQPDFQTNTPLVYQYVNGTDSNAQNPEIRFFESGTYTVCLETGNAIDTPQRICKQSYVWIRTEANVCSDDFLTDTSGYIFDDGGRDNDYGSSASCDMVLNPCADKINLSINDLDLKNNSAFLRIYDGKDASGEALWDKSEYYDYGLTGDTSHAGFQKDLVANSGAVYIEFESGLDPEGSGFEIEWSATGDPGDLNTTLNAPDDICIDDQVTFTAGSNQDNTTYQWYLNDFNTVEANAAFWDHTFGQTGTDTVYLVSNFCGNADTIERIVSISSANQAPDVGFTADLRYPQVSYVVTLQDTSRACITGRYWDIQPDNFEYVEGTDSSSKNPKVRFTQTGSYDITLTDTNAVGNNQLSQNGYIQVFDYCTPIVNNLNSDVGISRVQLANLDNQSDIGEDTYSSYINGTHAELEAGADYQLKVRRNTNLNSINYKVWVDTNRDGSFSSNEVLAFSGSINTQVWTTDLTIPKSVNTGDLRMRIGASLGSQANKPCGTNNFGEFEDYGIQLREDQTPPEITLQGADTLTIGACETIQGIDSATYAMDNVDGMIQQVNRTGNVDSASPGMYTLEYSAMDAAGNVGHASRVIEVLPDTEAPEVTFPDGDTTTLAVNQGFTPDYQTVDNCAGIDSVGINDSNLDNSSLGVYAVHYTGVDMEGNSAKFTQHVQVIDTVEPTVQLNGGARITVHLDSTFDDPGLQLDDNYWAEQDLNVTTTGSVNTNSVDSFTLTYNVTDGSGNTATAQRKVVVIDTIGPFIQWNQGDTVQLDVYHDLDVQSDIVVSDNAVTGAQLMDTTGNFYQNFPDGNATDLGFYSVGYVYVDASGNQASLDLTVEVVDQEAPVITMFGPSYTTHGRWDTTDYLDSVQVSDNYYNLSADSINKSGSYTNTYLAGAKPSGLYEIKYDITDGSGNSASTKTRVVEVVTTSIEGSEGKTQVEVYPNPTRGNATLELDFDKMTDFTVTLYNSNGKEMKKVAEGNNEGGEFEMNLGEFSAGMYLIKVNTPDGVVTKQITLQK